MIVSTPLNIVIEKFCFAHHVCVRIAEFNLRCLFSHAQSACIMQSAQFETIQRQIYKLTVL